MRAVIIINPYFDAPQYVRQYTRIAEELRAAGCDAVVMRADDPDVSVDERTHVDVDADFCVYLDKDKYLSLLLEKRGMRLFNSHAAIQACDDKMSTHALLSGHGIPMPLTVPASLCYTPGARATDAQLERVGRVLGFPVVVKSSYGSMGKGVYLAKDKAELRALADELASVPHLFQRFVSESAGRDLRVIVVGGKTVGGMLRSSETDFRSNVGAGGGARTGLLRRGSAVLPQRPHGVRGQLQRVLRGVRTRHARQRRARLRHAHAERDARQNALNA